MCFSIILMKNFISFQSLEKERQEYSCGTFRVTSVERREVPGSWWSLWVGHSCGGLSTAEGHLPCYGAASCKLKKELTYLLMLTKNYINSKY